MYMLIATSNSLVTFISHPLVLKIFALMVCAIILSQQVDRGRPLKSSGKSTKKQGDATMWHGLETQWCVVAAML